MKNKKEIDAWWKKFGSIKDPKQKIEMVKKACDKEFYTGLDIGTAIFDYIRSDFMKNQDVKGYCDFLERLRTDHPGVFQLDTGWHIRDLVYTYIFTSQPERVRDAVEYLIKHPKEDPDIIADLLDVLIVNGFTEEAWKLLQFYYFFLKKGEQTIPAGIYELSVLSSIFIIAKYVHLPKYDFTALKKELTKFDYGQKEKYLFRRIKILSDDAYKYKKWSKDDLTGKSSSKNLYFLSLEFARHLIKEKGMDMVLAQSLQNYLFVYYHEAGFSLKFNKEKTDEYLALLAGFVSLNQTRAFIVVCSLKLFYDFLKERKLVDNETYERAIKDINSLKEGLFKAFNDSMWKYKFAYKLLGDAD
jgi:hypothetical protein